MKEKELAGEILAFCDVHEGYVVSTLIESFRLNNLSDTVQVCPCCQKQIMADSKAQGWKPKDA